MSNSNFKQLEQIFLIEEIGETIVLDSSKLVREIKNYPIIYDNILRRDQTSIFLAWETICTNMLPNFMSMSENNKIATRKRLRDRWSYMRSTFRRDVVNENINCHKHLDWIREINFLVPILTRPVVSSNTSKNIRRNSKFKCFFNKNKRIQQEITSSIQETTNSNVNSLNLQLPSSSVEAKIIEKLEAISATKSDIIISSDSSSSDKSPTPDSILSNPVETEAEDKFENDLIVQSFLSTFKSESVLPSITDPDQLFLMTLLQNYRLVPNEKKEALQHKFYTFLRD